MFCKSICVLSLNTFAYLENIDRPQRNIGILLSKNTESLNVAPNQVLSGKCSKTVEKQMVLT